MNESANHTEDPELNFLLPWYDDCVRPDNEKRLIESVFREFGVSSTCEHSAVCSHEELMLVETSSKSGLTWLSFHETPEEAATYHLDQESSEGWETVVLIRVADDARAVPVPALTWREVSHAG